MGKIRVYCAISLDGFIAGPNDDLSWLGDPDANLKVDPGTVEFADFMAQSGALLMGRRTFEVARGFAGDWPYGDTPVLVATTRPLDDTPPTVSACRGDIAQLCKQAQQVAGDKGVYLDGGDLITQALDAECVDEMILTVVPVLLGRGVPLYRGEQLQRFDAEYLGRYGTMLQLALTRSSGR